ncbi:MAG TPA: YfhO family protein [Salinivirgaceae bacterium]|nr:YfhO family protein [Salinivirgaceae bacterium]
MKPFFDIHKIKPHLFALGIFLILSFGYFNPVLKGKMLRQGDMLAYAGSVQELKELQKSTGEYALWTDRLFGGMPTYLIQNPGYANLTRYIHNIINLFHTRPANHLFLYMIGFYLALLLFGISPQTAIAGAIAYAFSTYFIIIIDAGHITKVMALGYMPLIIGAFYYAIHERVLLGSILFAIALSLQIYVNHLQITYYTLISLIFLGLYEVFNSVRNKVLWPFFKKVSFIFVFAVLAIGANITTLWTVYEYGKFSMRGKPNIVNDSNKTTTGLPIDYITAWSYGKAETLNLLVPNLFGGSSHMQLGNQSHTYRAIEENYGKKAAQQYATYLDTYWGEQPFTSGPVYLGASVIFLFLLGMMILRNNLKWWLLALTVFAIFLAWGKHWMWFNELIINYLPGYNKFRTVSMTLVIVQFTIPLLGLWAFDKILKSEINFHQLKRPLTYATGGLTILLILLWILVPISANMIGQNDAQLPDVIQKSLQADRLSLFRNDIYRSLLFIFVTSGLIFAVSKNKLNRKYAPALLILLFILDLIPVSLRYAQNDNWVSKNLLQQQPFTPSAANNYILRDKEHYRVLNLSVNTFNDASTSYFHNSIGGYHGAKMQRYQELIDWQIYPEMRSLIDYLSKSPTKTGIDSLLEKCQVLNMLNTRYIILSPDNQPLINTHAFGQAWLIDSIVYAETDKDEMMLLNSVNLQKTAVLNSEYQAVHAQKVSENDFIRLTQYHPNRLRYQYRVEKPSLAAFSEIFYPKGWQAYINGTPVEILRINYLLRGAILPAGEGFIEFEFKPKSFLLGNKISYACSSMLLIIAFGVLIFSIFKPNTIKAFDEKFN